MDDRPDAARSHQSAARAGNGVSPRAKKIPAGAAALGKGLSLLDLVADAEEPLRFAQLQQRSALSKPTFARILRTLIAFGLVRHDAAAGTYSLGARFMELSHKVWDTFDLNAVAAPEIERLSDELGETVALCKIDQDSVLYLSEHSGSGLGVRVSTGQRVPLHCTAAGKVLLAFQEPAIGRALINRLHLAAFSDTTFTSITALNSDLALTRARGYAISYEEHLAGVNAVAVAIGSPDGTPLGALTLLAPASRLDETRIHPIGRELMAAARRITGSAGAVAINSHPRPRNNQSRKVADLTCALPWGAQLGEAPVWHPAEQRLYWVDILKPAVYRFDPQSGVNEVCEMPKLVSAILPKSEGGVMVATLDGIEALEFDTGALTPFCHPEHDIAGNRLNDAKVGPGGAIWIGSMSMDAARPTGGLYRVGSDGRAAQKEGGVTVSNGLGWSPDNKVFYFVDTVPGRIYAYDSAPGTGDITNRRVFVTIAQEDGRPDGITVDTAGGVWCALWDGWCIRRYAPDGRLDFSIELPVPRPTSVCFGGPGHDTLFITSARTRLPAVTLSEAPLSGGIFTFRPGFSGHAHNLFTPC